MSDYKPVSKVRLLLSLWFDFQFFAVIWFYGALLLALSKASSDMSTMVFAFIPLRVILLYWGAFPTPGEWLLGVKKGRSDDPSLIEQQHILTLLFGILLILEGCKNMVRWVQLDVAVPAMGVIVDPMIQPYWNVGAGIIGLVIGVLFLRLHPWAVRLYTATSFLTLTALISQWEAWDALVVEMVVSRRAVQGIAVKEGEIAFMQSLIPEIFVGFVIFALIALLFADRWFKPRVSEKSS
ncbi:hypothetical protein ACQZV8_09335 [Magnetococcales bacterium HHB-1]